MTIGIDVRLWNQTGVGRYIRNLVINLVEIDIKNQYFLFARSEDFQSIKSEVNSVNFKVIKADIKWHSLLEQINFPSMLNKENLDLVHFPYFSVPIFYNKPFVLTIHDLIIHHYPTGKASTLFPLLYYLKFYSYKYIIYKAAQKAKQIITPSISTKEEVIDHLGVNASKVIVTYEGVDEKIKNSKNSNEKLFDDYFLYIGNAYPHKNLEKLILAFEKLSKEKKDLKLILVGNIDYFYQKLGKKYKSDKIIFYGKASDEELSSLYSNALALVLPSLMEGFGLPVLEAMSSKCLVVCSDIPSFREIAKECAIYFNPEVVDEIYGVLKKVDLNKYDTKIVEKAYNRSLEFSWKKAARQTLKVYESSLSL